MLQFFNSQIYLKKFVEMCLNGRGSGMGKVWLKKSLMLAIIGHYNKGRLQRDVTMLHVG